MIGSRLHTAYRATGADLPLGDPLPAHGVAMEGYFWRFTDADVGRVIIALCGVNRDLNGAHWGTVGLGGHPGLFLREAEVPTAGAEGRGLGAWSGTPQVFCGGPDRLHVDLGPDARLDVRLHDVLGWTRRPFGGSGAAQSVPALNQYWHPHVLGGRAHGIAVLGNEEIVLDGAQVYAEKNWGKGGFPDSWWWGQAQGFARDDVCVAFAGGDVTVGPLRRRITAVVVRAGDEIVRLGDPLLSPVRDTITDTTWRLNGRSVRHEVEIEGEAPLGAAHILPVPLPAQRRNVPGALEHLAGRLRVTLRRHGRTIFCGESALAGLEHGGLDRAAAEQIRRRATV